MIHQLALDLEARLHARQYPVRVEYGADERLARGAATSYEIMIRRAPKGDAVRSIVASRTEPRNKLVRDLAVEATFYVQSRHSGAMAHEHERDCDALVDAFLVALHGWTVESKAGTSVDVTESRYLSPDEYNGSETFFGVVYRLVFNVARGVADKIYEDGAQLAAVIKTVSTATSVAIADSVTREETDGITT